MSSTLTLLFDTFMSSTLTLLLDATALPPEAGLLWVRTTTETPLPRPECLGARVSSRETEARLLYASAMDLAPTSWVTSTLLDENLPEDEVGSIDERGPGET
jgi:hypothetical protein